MRFAIPAALLVVATACNRDITIDVVDRAPEVQILRPVTDSLFDPTDELFLCAIIDDEDELDMLSLLLESSVDGVLANSPDEFGGVCEGGNASIQLSLSEAEHTLELTVRDPAGNITTDAVTVLPNVNTAPACEVITPVAETYEIGEPIDFFATGTDPEEDSSTLTVLFNSSIDGEFWAGAPDSSGEVAFVYDGLSAGDHYLTMLLTDGRGLNDICGVALSIDPCLDTDADGFNTSEGDCDDSDPSSNPDGNEIPDGRDNDCDGIRDEGTVLYDDDGDGVNELLGDCDDDDVTVFPGAVELPDDGIDQDCNGDDQVSCWLDVDGDRYGVATPVLAVDGDCKDPGEAESADDCDDGEAGINPGAFDLPDDGIDQDCTGDETVSCHVDVDNDGFGTSTLLLADDGDCDDSGEALVGGDCDDAVGSIYPGAAEVPSDTIDQDCNGADAVECAVDADGDGHGDLSAVLIAGDGDCFDVGESTVADDCNDAEADIFPGNIEIAGDGVDQNCDGSDAATCYVDNDDDDVGDSSKPTFEALDGDCDDPGEALSGGDCDDTDPTAYPGGTEVEDDGIDQDCSGADTVTCYVDDDGDLAGSTTALLATDGSCTDVGEAVAADDCDDGDATIYPTATETVADGIDQDCNGADSIWCFEDDDNDFYGSTTQIVAPDGDCDDAGESLDDTDCDDTDDRVYPGSSEFPDDSTDSDCNGFDGTLCFLDGDDDTYGVPVTILSSDDDCADSGESTTVTDCDDSSDSIHPGATETPGDGIDQDCSGVDAVFCRVDDDGDGFGSVTPLVSLDDDCGDARESDNADDCDDTDAGVNPAATEIAGNGVDENCDGTDAATCFVDNDDDGFGSSATISSADGDCTDPGESDVGGDCDDTDTMAYPGAAETTGDGIDQDCNGTDTVRCYDDADDDGYGSTTAQDAPDGNCTDAFESATDDDCDDTDALIYPGAGEAVGDGIDQDCNGSDSVFCFEDSDTDGYGSSTQITAVDGDCADVGESSTNDDCVDSDGDIHPNAPEVPGDFVDSDCNGSDGRNCQVDGDGDGYGIASIVFSTDDDCLDTGESSSTNDCDDALAGVHPTAVEVPDNGTDEDCNGFDSTVCSVDGDGDTYGHLTNTLVSANDTCLDAGETSDNTDCNDANASIYPGAVDTLGNTVDENCDLADGVDADGDTYASIASGGDDCDDTLDTIYIGATEIRDGYDNNCDLTCDEGLLFEGDLIFSEVMPDPASPIADSAGEFFEIYNTTATDIRICEGWVYRDDGTDSHLVNADSNSPILIPAGDVALFCKGNNPSTNGGLTICDYTGAMTLANGGDELVLEFEGLELDHVNWTGSWPWSVGTSMQLLTSDLTASDNDNKNNWCASSVDYDPTNRGTPRALNDDCP